MARTLPLVLLAALVAAPAASAHTTAPAADGAYCVTAGNLNEPVTTYVKTGLDLTIRAGLGAGTCSSADRGAEVAGAHESLQVTLLAPNGAELSQTLQPQFGSVGRYTFDEPYVLTETGEYFVHVTGTLGDDEIDVSVLVGSGPIPAFEDLTFPAAGLPSLQEIETRLAALEAHTDEDEESSMPSPGVLWTVAVALVGAALLYQRR
jgi:hypothetical protein